MAALLCLYHFLAMCAFCVIKPVRSALLLDRLGPEWLPVGFIGTALVTAGVVAATGWAARYVSTRFRVLATTLVLLFNLLAFRALFEAAGDWVALAFYVWAQVFSNVLFTQFWLVAGNQFTPREGKRLFGWVGTGATVGGIVGPLVTYAGLESLGPVNLIFVSGFFLALCMPLMFYFERQRLSEDTLAKAPAESALSGFNLFREFRHLKLIALISGVSMVVQTVLDYQFNAIVDDAFVSAEAKAAFFAKFFAGVNLAGLVFQLVFTRMVLMRFGIGVALFLLPGALLAGSVGILFHPSLWMAVAARLGETGTRYSIQEATREVLYLPLPAAVRSKARPLIHMVGDRAFEGAAGLVILVCTALLGLSVSALSLVSVVLISLWGITVLAVRHAYVDTLRDLFAELPVKPTDRAAEVLDDETVALLIEGLKNPDEVVVCQNLALLDLMHDKSKVLPHLKYIMAHPSAIVRARVLELLTETKEGGFVREAEALLKTEETGMRIAGLRYLNRFGDAGVRKRMSRLAHDSDLRVRVAAIGAMAQAGDMDCADVLTALQDLWHKQGAEAEAGRAEAARVLSEMDDSRCDVLMVRLLSDASPLVVRAALEGVAYTCRRFFVPLIVPHLADERLVLYAQRTLLAYGDRVLGTLRDYMDDPGESESLQRAVPGCLAAIGTQRAVHVLIALLKDHQFTFGEALIEALGEVRRRRPGLLFDEQQLGAALEREVGWRHRWRSLVWLQRVTGLLALVYPPEDIHRAYAGLTGEDRSLRLNALELLDNLLRPEHKRILLSALEQVIG